MTSDDKIKKLLATVARLSKLIHEENELLSRPGRQEGIGLLVDEKKALTAAYEDHIKGIGEASSLKDADPSVRRRLSEAVEDFSALTNENSTRLLAKIEATKRVFGVIQKADLDHGSQIKTYGNSGTVQGSVRQAFTPALSVGVNDEI